MPRTEGLVRISGAGLPVAAGIGRAVPRGDNSCVLSGGALVRCGAVFKSVFACWVLCRPTPHPLWLWGGACVRAPVRMG